MRTLALLIAAGASQPQQVPRPPDEPKPIVVTARRLDTTGRALQECIARKCPPDQEIDAALAHAENLFVAGDYFDARRTLTATIGRVDGRAKDYPEAVGDIWRARARIAQHMGEKDQNRIGQLESLSALRQGVPATDDRVFGQRIAVADAFAREGRTDLAIGAFRDIAKDGRKAGMANVEGTALLRIVLIKAAFYELQPVAFGAGLDDAVEALAKRTDPALAVYRDAALLLRDRLKIAPDDTAGIDRLIARYAPAPGTRPILIYQPSRRDGDDRQPQVRTVGGQATTVARQGDAGFDGDWADVTFRITADGRVEDVDVLREGPRFSRDWIAPTLKGIAGRRYARLILPAGKRSLRQVERYTLTAYWETPTGSRLRSRGFPRIEMLDLSPVSTAATADRPAVSSR